MEIYLATDNLTVPRFEILNQKSQQIKIFYLTNTINSTIIYLNNSGIRYCGKLEITITSQKLPKMKKIHM